MAIISQPVTRNFAEEHLPAQIFKSCIEMGVDFSVGTHRPIDKTIQEQISKQRFEELSSFFTFKKVKTPRNEMGIELTIQILDSRNVPVRVISELFFQREGLRRARFIQEAPIPRGDFVEPQDQFNDLYFRRRAVDRAFAETHLPPALFKFCTEKGVAFDQANEKAIDLKIENQESNGFKQAETSLLTFKRETNHHRDAIEINITVLDQNNKKIREISNLFEDTIWAHHTTVVENGMDYHISPDDLCHSFIEIYHSHLNLAERRALKERIINNPGEVPYFIFHFKHSLRARNQNTIKAIQQYHFDQKPSCMEKLQNRALSTLPLRVRRNLFHYQARLQDLIEPIKNSPLFQRLLQLPM